MVSGRAGPGSERPFSSPPLDPAPGSGGPGAFLTREPSPAGNSVETAWPVLGHEPFIFSAHSLSHPAQKELPRCLRND